MGQIADDAINGTTCCLCGVFFEGETEKSLYIHGYPVVCWECWDELTKKERKNYQRSLRPDL